jgi:pimeloyl-ACP methyl ester carboxylesterase
MTAPLADTARTKFVSGPSTRFAYRRFGPTGGVPLVLAARFRGTIDHWDPMFLDELAGERDVVIFDNAGIGLSSGETPRSILEMALSAVEFVLALGLGPVDLLGWSMGGYVAQTVALEHRGLVRRLVVAGSGPGGVPDAPARRERVVEVMSRPENDDEDFLPLFFPDTPPARESGRASLRRLQGRLARSHAVVKPESFAAQLAANAAWNSGINSAWERLREFRIPVLVANGAHDAIVHAYQTYAMSQRLPEAKIIIYSDAGHGFLFQHPEDFGNEVRDFLR